MSIYKVLITTVKPNTHYNPSEYYTFDIYDPNDIKVYDNDDSFLNLTDCKIFAKGKLEEKFNVKSAERYSVVVN